MKKCSLTILSAQCILLCLLSCQQHLSTASENAESKVYIVYMGERQHSDPSLVVDSHHTMLANVLGGSKEVAANSILCSYKHGFSGFAATLTDSQAKMIADTSGVLNVIPNSLVKLHTTRSWDYLGLSIPDHANTNLLNKSNMGDDTIIGVIDSGIWPESKSFSDQGLGPIPSRWKGSCEDGDQFNSTNCNRKLIGARWFIKGLLALLKEPFNATEYMEYLSPRDAVGHGTHTSAIAAGSLVPNVNYKGLAMGTARGGAPRARLATYKACWNIGMGYYCSSADVLKAFDEAIHDGVDVLSLPHGLGSPFGLDAIAVGSFHAVAKGITVVCSAGNSGPHSQTVENIAPWIISVAASTMDRSFPSLITLGNNQTILGQAMFTGHKDIGFTSLISPKVSDDSDVCTCESLTPNNRTMAGKVVLCFGSTSYASLIASDAVNASGGVGLVIAKSPGIIRPWDELPVFEVDYEVGKQILSYIGSSKAPVVKLSPSYTLVGKPLSAKIARFSSRGPSSLSPEILKPDIAAPGVNVLTAFTPNDPDAYRGFAFATGTSMSCAHVSGIVVLLKSLHPSWSQAAIRSALTTTGSTTSSYEEPIFTMGDTQKLADPFDYGGGIVNPNLAADPGLIYDMDTTDYVHYFCSIGYSKSAISALIQNITVCPSKKPSMLDLNLPSITIPNLRASETVTRTVTNVGPIHSTYVATVEHPLGVQIVVRPQMLVFNSTVKKRSFTVTLSSSHKVIGGYYFGSLSWSDGTHRPAIPCFDGHYDHWSMLMENFSRSKEYWTVVVSGVAEPTAGVVLTDAQKMELGGQKLKDLKAKNYLFQAINRSILETILCKETSKQIWDSMKKYEGTAKVKRVQLQALRGDFETLRMKSGESVSDYFSRTMAISNKMRTHGEKIADVTH
ncbi:subtilisin-like protein protease SBT3.9 isoform X1 [Cinnamomum micranthum f. kanehirae]|uniref:Subtilisin-like protein protease SBT3.9 isoform X1 n=1 Tax=Cinnamomum micranthum f. kanehirae TaxID=337451 RepID=A0A443PAD1_9MAGN|nr:subtilisin-like protein protease SBT3.9 isoform X1 [Cinnamomum micranthum f. kanehirae]